MKGNVKIANAFAKLTRYKRARETKMVDRMGADRARRLSRASLLPLQGLNIL